MNNGGKPFSVLWKEHSICRKRHIDSHGLGWNAWKAQHTAQEMYDRIFQYEILTAGSWPLGYGNGRLPKKRNCFAALNNCAFVSTENIIHEFSNPFCFLMDASMLGVGVGFDTKGEEGTLIAQRAE